MTQLLIINKDQTFDSNLEKISQYDIVQLGYLNFGSQNIFTEIDDEDQGKYQYIKNKLNRDISYIKKLFGTVFKKLNIINGTYLICITSNIISCWENIFIVKLPKKKTPKLTNKNMYVSASDATHAYFMYNIDSSKYCEDDINKKLNGTGLSVARYKDSVHYSKEWKTLKAKVSGDVITVKCDISLNPILKISTGKETSISLTNLVRSMIFPKSHPGSNSFGCVMYVKEAIVSGTDSSISEQDNISYSCSE